MSNTCQQLRSTCCEGVMVTLRITHIHTVLACQLRWVAVKAKTQRVGLKIAFRKPPLVFIWVYARCAQQQIPNARNHKNRQREITNRHRHGEKPISQLNILWDSAERTTRGGEGKRSRHCRCKQTVLWTDARRPGGTDDDRRRGRAASGIIGMGYRGEVSLSR